MRTKHIEIETDSTEDAEKAGIGQAIERNWAMVNQDVSVYVSTHKVVLNGTDHSIYKKE